MSLYLATEPLANPSGFDLTAAHSNWLVGTLRHINPSWLFYAKS